MTSTSTPRSVYAKAFDGTASENYERYFVPAIGRPFAEDLIREAALQPGERVLDAACGTGIIARLAAKRVAPGGSVDALDINPAMLSVARSLASPSAAPIRWFETSVESIPLPDDMFDVVICHLGLQFVAGKHAALREMRRVASPGGRVLVSTPRPSHFFEVLERAVSRHVGEEPGRFVRMVFSLDDARAIEQLFQAAGFRDVAVRTDRKSLRLPPARDFLWQYIHCTPLTALLSQLGSDRTAAMEDEVARGWQPWSRDDGMTYEQEMNVATARR
ncbi:MAG TPA: methyltransferase domain-containing protein [Vicinamibacterales bacterium]|nr:methyltransferase domain-containing protein [Vicinamibacterales bacterium]